jgi:DNA-binding transcriptional LysR family regulator
LRVVAESDLLTCVPSGFVNADGQKSLAERGLEVRAFPFETDKLIHRLVWHERLHTHPARQWFRSLVADVCGLPTDTAEMP